jgi:structural maintenance of chromosome 2
MFDYQMSLKRFTELEHDQKLRQKKINFKVEAMSEKVEKDFESLTKKRATLLDDFTLMNSNIESLD